MSETYLSRKGKGPGIARIIDEGSDLVIFEYKSHPKDKRWNRYALPRKFWYGKSCGWKPARIAARGAGRG